MRAAFLVVLSFLLHPLKVLFTKTTSNNTTNNSRRGFRRRRFLRASFSRETETTPPSRQCHRLSKDETMWLFPHRIDPMFEDDDEENTKYNNIRSGRSERSCHVWFENGYVWCRWYSWSQREIVFRLFVSLGVLSVVLSLSCLVV